MEPETEGLAVDGAAATSGRDRPLVPDGELRPVGGDWETLAVADPYWAVLVDPDYKGNRWPVEDFLESGRADWAAQREWLASLGMPTTGARALDFGCGVGRVTFAIADSFDSVVGVDIAPSMLRTATWLDTTGGRCRFVQNGAADLSAVDEYAPFDLVHSVIALQHVPRQFIAGYIAEFVRLLRPGGVLTFQLPERPQLSVRGLAFRYLSPKLTGFVQQRFLGYPAPMRMSGMRADRVREVLHAAGATLLATRRDNGYAGYWHSNRYVAMKTGGSP